MTTRAPSSYRDVATLRGHVPLLYQEFGSYQGDWLMFARDPNQYLVYRGSYGSCSGCDDLQSEFSYEEDVPQKKVDEWVEKYPPFVEIPRATARNLAKAGKVGQVFPANFRKDYDDIPYSEVIEEATLLIKLEEGLSITVEETLATRNQETRRRIIERDGIAQFLETVGATILHTDGVDKLIRFGDGDTYLWLQDSSTDREYILRVPSDMERVRQAKAWSFNVTEAEYAPLIET